MEIGKKQPRPLCGTAKAFHDGLHAYNAQNDNQSLVEEDNQNMLAAPPKNTACLPIPSPNCEDLPLFKSSNNINVLKDFLSLILAQPDAMYNPVFFKFNISCTMTVQDIATKSFASKQAADAPEDGQQKQKSASVTHENVFDEEINPEYCPILQAKQISVESDKGIAAAVLRDIIKLSKKVKSVDVLKVVNYNDATTSLVKVPCSTKQSGFKQQVRSTRWLHEILQSVHRYNAEDLVAGVDEEKQEVDQVFAYSDDNAARWSTTYLGECYPSKFVKSAQPLDMPIHQGKMHVEYTTAMWSDAGVGVAAQHIIANSKHVNSDTYTRPRMDTQFLDTGRW
jgi:hypothetical protein